MPKYLLVLLMSRYYPDLEAAVERSVVISERLAAVIKSILTLNVGSGDRQTGDSFS
tara:strand:- start:20845 stop:21012 length:168 start_codon:yes stop_codon:yes gene_type:complete